MDTPLAPQLLADWRDLERTLESTDDPEMRAALEARIAETRDAYHRLVDEQLEAEREQLDAEREALT